MASLSVCEPLVTGMTVAPRSSIRATLRACRRQSSAHVDHALEAEQGGGGGAGHSTVLAGAGFGMMRVLPMRLASSAWPSTLLILCEPVWFRSSRLRKTRTPPACSAKRLASVSSEGRSGVVLVQVRDLCGELGVRLAFSKVSSSSSSAAMRDSASSARRTSRSRVPGVAEGRRALRPVLIRPGALQKASTGFSSEPAVGRIDHQSHTILFHCYLVLGAARTHRGLRPDARQGRGSGTCGDFFAPAAMNSRFRSRGVAIADERLADQDRVGAAGRVVPTSSTPRTPDSPTTSAPAGMPSASSEKTERSTSSVLRFRTFNADDPRPGGDGAFNFAGRVGLHEHVHSQLAAEGADRGAARRESEATISRIRSAPWARASQICTHVDHEVLAQQRDVHAARKRPPGRGRPASL